ncbi:efflux RND transporter periplasmic adaptor subunit [bacterium]|jgi:HlyD family secretion protein|nr:efflux RND transporter periplasmic adaptor subunit [bacterium]
MEKIKNIFSKIKALALSHKIISVLILIVLIATPFAINYFLPQKATISYVTQAVKKGNISIAISGTGQVSSLKSVDLSAEVAGSITGVYVEEGEEINKGDVLFRINSAEGRQSVKSAEIALENAELGLEEMLEPADELTLIQAENALTDAQESKTKAEEDLEKSYSDGFISVSNAFLDLPSVVTGMNNILFAENLSSNGSQQNIDFYASVAGYYDDKAVQYRNDAYTKYMAAKAQYEIVIAKYKAASRFSNEATIESLITETYEATKDISEAIKSVNDLIELYKYVLAERQQTYNTTADTHLSSLSSYTSKTNSHLSNLLSASNTIEDSKDSIVSAERSIKVKELSLADVKEGATDLEIRTQKLTIEEKEQALVTAQETLAKYTITAPFSGIVSSVDVDNSDTVKSGTVMGSIITNDMIATITLNEVDIAKVKVGQKVDITFDALDDVVIEGEVATVDATGTVSQGVVSYDVDISFDTDNESVKPGMSISANIITESVSDVLVTASSAVKTMGDKSFVEVMNSDGKIERKAVEIGITDDASIEIKSGLSEGDKVVTSTTTSTKKTTTTKTTTNTKSNLNTLTNTGGGTPPSGGMGPGM